MSHPGQNSNIRKLTLAAIGVVYGDIGTSPLYTLHECFSPHIGLKPEPAVVMGFLSLILWAQILVVSVKYLAFVMRADNKGEGGILTLMSLAGRNTPYYTTTLLLILGLIGGGLFYGDSIITPAMSVLSALEGIEVVAPGMARAVVPASIVVLFFLFHIQSHGTEAVGKFFGPIMVAWFVIIGFLGLRQIVQHPDILQAMHPKWALQFLTTYRFTAFLALGAVVLSITGGEALYADMGHFGKRPIRLAWFTFVSPALILNYFGQGALILSDSQALENPFYRLAPEWAIVPLVILATLATIIASQAVISGAFSMTRQAVRMGYLPNMKILHTSADEAGQIYMPLVNWGLFIAILVVILLFRESSKLAAAYGIAVTGTMAITTLLACYVAIYNWDWPRQLVKGIGCLLLAIDLPFFCSNAVKILDGGWLPLGVGTLTFAVMAIWKWEHFQLLRQISRLSMSLEQFNKLVAHEKPLTISGTAVYLAHTDQGVPHALIHNLRHNHVLHERIIFMTFRTQDIPYVDREKHIEIKTLAPNVLRMAVTYGFHETPEIEQLCLYASEQGVELNLASTTFFFSRETLTSEKRSLLSRLRAALFIFLRKNALRPHDVIHIPPGRVIEMGMQLRI